MPHLIQNKMPLKSNTHLHLPLKIWWSLKLILPGPLSTLSLIHCYDCGHMCVQHLDVKTSLHERSSTTMINWKHRTKKSRAWGRNVVTMMPAMPRKFRPSRVESSGGEAGWAARSDDDDVADTCRRHPTTATILSMWPLTETAVLGQMMWRHTVLFPRRTLADTPSPLLDWHVSGTPSIFPREPSLPSCP